MSNLILEKPFFFAKNSYAQAKKISVLKSITDLNQSIYIPGSKSIANRALILAGMSTNSTTLHKFLFAQDTYYGLLALQTLGFHINCNFEKEMVVISPSENRMGDYIFLGKAGTLARFFPAVILNWQNTFPRAPALTVTLDGEEQLKKRPLGEYLTALKTLDGIIDANSLPTKISSSSLGGVCEISGRTSGQFLSGLLLAACGAKNKITIHRKENLVQPNYIEITIKMIQEFGGKIIANKELTKFEVYPIEKLGRDNYIIEADASTACYFICLAFLHNFNLSILNLGKNTLQPDYKLTYILQEIGASIFIEETKTHVLKKEKLTQIKFSTKINCSDFSDQALTLGVLALFSNKPVEFYGIGHIRHHESDRISCFVKNLTNLGCEAYEKQDGFVVKPIEKNCREISGVWETFNDHRFAMSGFLLASLCPNVKINNPVVVEKTAPQFFELVKTLGFDIIAEE